MTMKALMHSAGTQEDQSLLRPESLLHPSGSIDFGLMTLYIPCLLDLNDHLSVSVTK